MEQPTTPAPLFAALGNVTRLMIVERLSDGKKHSITALANGLDQTRQSVTKHLKVLQHAGIVENQRIGRERVFTIRPDSVLGANDYLTRVSNQWNRAIERLQSAVEQQEAAVPS